MNGYTKLFAMVMIALQWGTAWAQDFDFPILVTDGIHSYQLIIGVDPNGTGGYDPGLDVLAPPPPPSGAFDARLRNGNEDYFTDIRDNSLQQKEFLLLYAPAAGQQIRIYWDSQQADSLGDFQMIDVAGGALFSLDMTTTDSLIPAWHTGIETQLKILLTPASPTAIANPIQKSLSPDIVLHANYPNPFNNSTIIPFYLETDAEVDLSVYDLNGQKVITLISGNVQQGFHKIQWNGKMEGGDEIPSGLYFCVLKAKEQRRIRPVILIR